jgi:hypothetical protein
VTDYTQYKYGIVLDDPLTDTALDDVQRAKMQEWFQKSFAERMSKTTEMILIQGNMWDGNTATTASATPPAQLTLEKLLETMREIERKFPPPVRVDLYGHDLGDQTYELNRSAKERRFIVVPRNELDKTYHMLRDAGVDVRLEPRYGEWPDEGPE